MQSQLPPLGVQGRRPSSKSLCHQATGHYETQMMFFLRMALFGWKAWHGDGRQAGMDKQGQIRMLILRKPRCPEGWRFLLSFSLFSSNLPWSPYPSWEPSSRKAASPHHCFLGQPQSTHSMYRLPNISTQRIYLLPPYFLLLQNLPFPSYLPLEPPSPRE